MSTLANRAKVEERENERYLQKSVQLLKIGMIALCSLFVAIIIALIILDINYKDILGVTTRLEKKDSDADKRVKDLGSVFAGMKMEVDRIVQNNEYPDHCHESDIERTIEDQNTYLTIFKPLDNWQTCRAQCRMNPACLSWSYTRPGVSRADKEQCRIKNNYGDRVVQTGVISGIRNCEYLSLLERYKGYEMEQRNFTAEMERQRGWFYNYIIGYHYDHYFTYVAPQVVEAGSGGSTSGPCEQIDKMGSGSSASRSLSKVMSWEKCSDYCREIPSCKTWTWTTKALRPSYRRYKCYFYITEGALRPRKSYMSGLRECGMVLKETRAVFKHYPKYHATFIGFGCHAASCDMSKVTNKYVIPSLVYLEECLDACYWYLKPVFEFTFNPWTGECHCHFVGDRTDPFTYTFVSDSKQKHLKFVLS